MIYILCGNDIKKRGEYIKRILKNSEVFRLSQSQLTREIFIEYASSSSLFGDSPTIISDNVLRDEVIKFSSKDWTLLQESKSIFIFIEDSLLSSEEKKYKKYATIEHFDEKKVAKISKVNTFAIADSFARKDKITTWILYNEAIENGVEPEAISGMLFWKIKTLLLNGSRIFNEEELKHQSSEIISMYHRSHLGKSDFVVGLEQFILTALAK